MMRGQRSMAIAVRKANGQVSMRKESMTPIGQRFPVLRLPLLRGVAALFEALFIGIRALTWSAAEYSEEEEEGELTFWEYALSIVPAFLLAIGLFVALPALLLRWISPYIGSDILLNLIEGAIKISFFLAYILAISWMEEIRRVFQYHGAEHKAINCLEAGDELTVENVARHSRFHKRCGTSFIVLVLMISVLIFSFFGRPPLLLRILYHLAILPVVAGISYEVIRLAGGRRRWWIIELLSKPGIWSQHLTTREPDESQIEVAIQSLEAVVADDRAYEPTAIGRAAKGRPADAEGGAV